MHVTAFYAALLGLLFVVLSVRTLRLRRRLGITVGDSGNPAMLRAMRVHANFAEYVPLCLLLTGFVEAQGAPAVVVHIVGACLLLGRVSHAYGVGQQAERFGFRVFGMAMTLSTIVVTSVYLLFCFARSADA